MSFQTERGPVNSGSIAKDRITLATTNIFEKLAHSYAAAQSVKVSVFEEAITRTILRTKNIPEEMMRTGKLPDGMSNEQVSKHMGALFVQRSRVNLHTDI